MATQATWFDKWFSRAGGPGASPQRGTRRAPSSEYRVRALPNEDVCLWIKNIDNSRVERRSDPETRQACLRMISAVTLFVLLVVGLLLPNAYSVMAGYQIHDLQRQERELQDRLQELRAKQASLRSMPQLERHAQQRRFTNPKPENVVYLQPKPDASLAMRVAR